MGKRGNGEGSISRRKSGGWMARYVVPTAEGARKRRTIYGKTRAEVAKKLAKAVSDREGGLVFDDKGLTVGEYLESWLSDCVEVRRLYNEKSKRPSPRSVDYLHVPLRKALNQAMRDDLIPRNVAAGERPRSSRQRNQREADAFSQEQVKALLAAASGERNEALYIVAVHTGLRQGDLLGLEWTDVDLSGATGELSVRRSLKVTAEGLGFGPPKNKASRRSVPMNKTAVAALKAHRKRQNEERLRTPEWTDSGLVFPNRVGRPMDHNNLYHREYKALLKKAGLAGQGFTFHSLRHTFGTALFERASTRR